MKKVRECISGHAQNILPVMTSFPVTWLHVSSFPVRAAFLTGPADRGIYTTAADGDRDICRHSRSSSNTHRVRRKNPIIFWKPIIRFCFGWTMYMTLMFLWWLFFVNSEATLWSVSSMGSSKMIKCFSLGSKLSRSGKPCWNYIPSTIFWKPIIRFCFGFLTDTISIISCNGYIRLQYQTHDDSQAGWDLMVFETYDYMVFSSMKQILNDVYDADVSVVTLFRKQWSHPLIRFVIFWKPIIRFCFGFLTNTISIISCNGYIRLQYQTHDDSQAGWDLMVLW
jgi:hypothetical protein